MDLSRLSEFIEVRNDKESLSTYGKDWSVNYPANAAAVVFPKNEEELIQLISWARTSKVSLVPSGGRTGLSSAATATNGEVVVSFDQMNQVLEFNEVDRTLRVQAGVVTEKVHQVAEEKGYYFPVDFAAKGSSQIGGNVATNVGGIHVLRYGPMRDWVAGIKVITGTGDKLYLNKSLVKNATGYDLKNLIIGSEGTLGFITEVELKVTNPPENSTVLVLGLPALEQALDVYSHFYKNLQLSACEFFSQLAMEKVLALHDLSRPFDTETPFYLLLEIQHKEDDISEALAPLFEECFEQGWVNDGIISQSPQQAKDLWKLREYISESLAPMTPYKNDVAVRVSDIAKFSKEIESEFTKEYADFDVVLFGHIGDGNLHINILKPDSMDKDVFIQTCQSTDKKLFEIIEKYEGAVSAEHGVGLVKKQYLNHSRSDAEIEIMRQIKKVFDPDGILNPGKIFEL